MAVQNYIIIIYISPLQVYWFHFIVRLLWKIVCKGGELEDTREIEEEGVAGNVKNGGPKKEKKEQ